MLHHITTKHHRPIGFLLIGLGLLISVLFVVGAVSTNASSSENVFGAAWSSTIGWIAFNSCDYPAGPGCSDFGSVNFGVNINQQTGLFSGAAWSSNIGWVSFNQSDTSVCGSNARVSNIQNVIPNGGSTPVTGWARALNPGISGDGFWDGCISLSSTNPGGTGNPPAPYGVIFTYNSQSLSNLTGSAWGDEVLGWISFSGANHHVDVDIDGIIPLVTISANPNPITLGGNGTTLTWTSHDVSGCTTGSIGSFPADPLWPAQMVITPLNGTLSGINPSVDTTYHIECNPTDINQAVATDSVTVTVNQPATTVFLKGTHEFPPITNRVPYQGGTPPYATDLTWWTTTPGLVLDDCSLNIKNGNGAWTWANPSNPSYSSIQSPGYTLSTQKVFAPPSTMTSYQLTGCTNPISGTTYSSNIATFKPATPHPSINFGDNECIRPQDPVLGIHDSAYIHWETTDILSCVISNGQQNVTLTDSDLNHGSYVSPFVTTIYTINSCLAVPGVAFPSPTPVTITVDESCDPPPPPPGTNPNPRPIFEEF